MLNTARKFSVSLSQLACGFVLAANLGFGKPFVLPPNGGFPLEYLVFLSRCEEVTSFKVILNGQMVRVTGA